MSSVKQSKIGVIGLGKMGLGMALSIVRGGFEVIGFDPRAEAMAEFVAGGGRAAGGSAELLAGCEVVLTSLVAGVYLKLAEDVLLPNCRTGQIFIDTSTIAPPRTRLIAGEFARHSATALDAPVTGGTAAAAMGQLRMFVGGDRAAFERCREMLQATCKAGCVYYGGPAGSGQVMKIVQQLKNRITDAVRLEVISFGLRAGLSFDQVRDALDIKPGERDPYQALIDAIERGEGDSRDVVLAEWPYYLEEANDKGIPMPALESIYQFCRDGENICPDGVGRLAPSIWRELQSRPGPAIGE